MKPKSLFLKYPFIISIAAAVIITLFAGFLVFRNKPLILGDGYEYYSMLESFGNHFTFDLRREDILGLKAKWEQLRPGYYRQQVTSPISGYYNSDKGGFYSYHFWLYSLLNYPAKILLSILGISELYAFAVTNLLFLLLLFVMIAFYKPLFEWQKILMMLIIAAGPLYKFFKWAHPEIFSFCAVAISLLFFERKNYFAAILVVSLAANQNLPIILLAVFYLLYFLYENREKGLAIIKKAIPFLAIMGLSLISVIFYYLNYSTFNLIVKIGAASPKLFSLGRALELFFDPNIGLLSYATGLVLVTSGIIIHGVYNLYLFFRKKSKDLDFSLKVLGVTVATLVMGIIASGSTNWNHGTEGPSRYALWIVLPVCIYLLLIFLPKLNDLFRKKSMFFSISLLCFVLLFSVSYFFPAENKSFLDNTTLGKFILTNFPAFYNPSEEIFAERVAHREDVPDTEGIIYAIGEGNCRKALITDYQGNADKLEPVCKKKPKIDTCWEDKCYVSF